MIHEVGVELGEYLAGKKCPFLVIDGPEVRGTTTYARERVVIEHDPAGDSFGSRRQANTNARTYLTRQIGVKVTIFAKSPKAGATYWEHKRRAEKVLDLVLCGLHVVASPRKNLVEFKSGKFFFPEDLKESETHGGAAYELLLTFDRGVSDAAWDGTAQPTATVGATQTTSTESGATTASSVTTP